MILKRGGLKIQIFKLPLYSEWDRKKSSEWANLAKMLDFGSPEGVLSTSSG